MIAQLILLDIILGWIIGGNIMNLQKYPKLNAERGDLVAYSFYSYL